MPEMARTDVASRLIAAPPDRVYAAMTDPGALARWLPPTGMSARFERFEPWPGGRYRLTLTYESAPSKPGKSSADSDVVDARFLVLEPDVMVRQAVDFESEDPAFAGTMTMTWSLEPASDGATLVEFRAQDVPAGIAADEHAAGLSSSLANLAAYLTGG
jgi:uncharacterized protein YndB with AHSA1/START domain